ncbi:hypothetical protein Q0Z83_025150 [Actinoplanes sichuanensis]|uniref:ESX secretion-associated protein EspG n=1 Tax=Actinoplanes sichuanensis TaxID=512349 RepID=A0ABW4A0E0_9ACTN|nr:hypothetical protein [Actinoplanes sichuanensis]BEL04324.1 hypothetical protein Q0Z83_025150 [Actinoplanes sichuanensis]
MISADSTPEFDRFGPWIDEVRDFDDLPRLYQSAGIDPAAYRLVLKVPRDIERRNAHPDMHLYDYLLAVDEENLTVLARRDDHYDTHRIPHDRIAAIADSVRLLNGLLSVHTVDGPVVTVRYNGSANGPIRELITLLRRWYVPQRTTVPADAYHVEPVLDRADTGLLTDYHRMVTQEPGMRPVNVAGRRVVTPVAGLARVRGKVWPTVLHASIVAADDREIQVIHRRDWFTGTGDDLSSARTVLPRSRITGIQIQPHPAYRGVQVLTVRAGAAGLDFFLAGGALVEAVLAGHPVSI